MSDVVDSEAASATPRTTANVSLVVPSYRRGSLIEKTLTSVRAQSVRPAEVIVVNDGGYRGTTDYVASAFPDVNLVNIPHGGAATARNRGVERARHRRVVLLDDDDALRPHAIETLVRLADVFPEAAAVHTDHAFTDVETGEHQAEHHASGISFQRLRRVRPISTRRGARLYGRSLHFELLKGNLLQQPWMVDRDAYLSVGGFRDGLGAADDWDLYLRITGRYLVAVSDEVISDHYREPGRPHLTSLPGQAERNARILRDRLAEAPLWDARTRWVAGRQLAGIEKGLGDAHVDSDWAMASRHYLRSWAAWPLDPVVVLRLPLWMLRSLKSWQ